MAVNDYMARMDRQRKDHEAKELAAISNELDSALSKQKHWRGKHVFSGWGKGPKWSWRFKD